MDLVADDCVRVGYSDSRQQKEKEAQNSRQGQTIANV